MVSLIPMLGVQIPVAGIEIELYKLVISLLILAVGVLVARLARSTARRLLAHVLREHTLRITERVLYYSVIFVAALAALTYVGIDLTGAILAGGILGIIIGFATQSVVANLVSGLFLQMDNPFKIGDPVEVVDAGFSGVVTDITTFSTRLRTWDGVHVRVPNEKVFTSRIRNFSRNVARRVELTVGVAYREDVAKAVNTIRKMLDEDPLVLAEPAPEVFVDSFGESSVKIAIYAWAPWQLRWQVRKQLLEQTKRVLEAAGIEIPFPQRVVWLGEQPKKTPPESV